MISKECKIKLELVQLNGIVKLLLEKCEPELLELRVQNLLDSEIKDVKKALGRMSRKQLIYLVEQVTEIKEEDINRVYELNRYGLKLGFTLCYLGGKCKKLELDDLKENLVNSFKSIKYKEDDQYKQICCKSVEKITNDTFEVALSYLVKQSPIVFIQQLGRGLRKAKNKEYVVIIDFIGNYMNNFMIPIALSGDGSYHQFCQIVDKEYKMTLSEQETSIISFVSNYLVNGNVHMSY